MELLLAACEICWAKLILVSAFGNKFCFLALIRLQLSKFFCEARVAPLAFAAVGRGDRLNTPVGHSKTATLIFQLTVLIRTKILYAHVAYYEAQLCISIA
mgnify:CR=1 FL=1